MRQGVPRAVQPRRPAWRGSYQQRGAADRAQSTCRTSTVEQPARNTAVPQHLFPALQRFNREFDQHGPTSKGVCWRSEDDSLRRFGVLTQILDVPKDVSSGVTVHDFGCGYGALFDFIRDHPLMRDGHYLGTDMSDRMIAAARQRVHDPRAQFSTGTSATTLADFTLVSGTFNLRSGIDEAEWSEHTRQTLRKLWAHTRRGLAFNLLHDGSWQLPDHDLFYANAREWHRFARTLSPRAELVLPATRNGLASAGMPSACFVRTPSTDNPNLLHATAHYLLGAGLWMCNIRMSASLPPTDITILLEK